MNQPPLDKRLGQHHLRDGLLCRPLVEYLAPAGHRVVEIGAGGGVLTAELVAAGGRVVACEVDLGWALTLRRRLAGRQVSGRADDRNPPRVVVLDALCLDWRRLEAPTLVTGNLPFAIATRVIEGLLPNAATVPRAAFMVQREVAQRLVASPGDSAYGSLSVLVRAQAVATYLGTLAPASFRPPPKVAAGLIGLELVPPPVPAAHMPAFTRLVRLAFAMRRKTLRNSLASGLGRERSDEILRGAGMEDRCRAESLDVASFVKLFEASKGLFLRS